jgi:WD40 repeat protein
MIIFTNENILKLIFSSTILYELKNLSKKIKNRFIYRIILKILNNKSVFKSLGKDFDFVWVNAKSITTNIILLENNKIIRALSDNTLEVWNLVKHQRIKTLIGHESRVYIMLTLPDGKLISTSERQIRIWNCRMKFKCVKVLKKAKYDSFNKLLYLNNGCLAVSASRNEYPRILILDCKNQYRLERLLRVSHLYKEMGYCVCKHVRWQVCFFL